MPSPFGQNRNPLGSGAHQPAKEDESWLLTYADTITVIMAFFIMILAVSKIDMTAFEDLQSHLRKKFAGKETAKPLEEIKKRVQQIIVEKQLEDQVSVDKDKTGVVIEFASSAVFQSGKADLLPGIKPAFQEMARELKSNTYQGYTIEIEGHTDDTPIHSREFPSNWELSTRRATNVVRFMLDERVEQRRLKVAGYADIYPKAPNRDADGKPIPENQAKNRRIIIRLVPGLPMDASELATSSLQPSSQE